MKSDIGHAVERQWAMLRCLPRAPRSISALEVCERLRDQCFVVTKRTVERDLQSLSNRFPLYMDNRSKPYGWSWMKDANFEFMPKLSSSQAVALLLARQHLRVLLPISMHEDLQPLFDMASKELASSNWENWHSRTAVIPTTLGFLPPTVNLEVLEVVQKALVRRKILEGSYRTKGSKEQKQYRINPLGLVSRGPVLYLICTLFNYSDVKQLAMHRLSDVSILSENAQEPVGFDFQEYIINEGRTFFPRGFVRLVARFDAGAAEQLNESPLSKDQIWEPVEAGARVEVTATVNDDETLRWWLLAYGDQVEVLEPQSLREFMRATLEDAISKYKPE